MESIMETYLDVLFAKTPHRPGLGIITLNRPLALNALNHAMFKAIDRQLTEWIAQSDVGAVLIRAVKGRAFSAGGDIRSVYENKLANNQSSALFNDEYQLNRRIFHCPKPYIALLDGITMGGGAGLSIHGGYRVATENLVFAMPETAIGFFPDIGASYFLSRLPHKWGLYLGLTGERIAYNDCYALGLVDAVIASDTQEEWVKALTQSASYDKQTITALIEKFAIQAPRSALLDHQHEVEHCFAHSSIEAIIGALQQTGTEWCKKTAETMLKRSPTSLKVALQELTSAEHLDFDGCMDMEHRIMTHFMQSHDFIEGIRAAVIDKDQRPRWQPNTLSAVTKAAIAQYFK